MQAFRPATTNMCGIVGIVESDLTRPVGPAELARMVRTLRHRGPDEEGSVTLPGVGLGMRRLSIVDLAGGRQPFTNEDGTIRLVANGEIYNFPQVRKELVDRGHRFSSQGDIEVLVHAYEEYGESFLKRIRGMFALALWDGRTRTLIAARDRAGEKPLYYAVTSRGLFLASEIKALLVRSEVPRDLDLEALDQFLTYEYIVAPRTIFTAIKKLPAGHYLRYRDGAVSLHRYWDAADVAVRPWTEREAAEALTGALRRAVMSQMMADVPLGVFLSGGIDSSTIVAFMAEALRGTGLAVNSFSMGFHDGSYNELPYAREVAQRFKTNHREQIVTPDLTALFERLTVHLDEPFADVSLFPTYLVSEMAREHVKVVLAGDGGDELFGGYDAYAAQRIATTLQAFVPAAALSVLGRLASLFPPSEKKKGLVNKVQRFLEGVSHPAPDIQQYRWMTFLAPAAKHRLYAPPLTQALAGSDVYRPVRDALGAYAGSDHLNRQLYADLSIYLADDILVKVDRMSMATSLETRAPFLDQEVMELAFSMPGDLKVKAGERKYILKRAVAGILPDTILARKKEGFSIPMKNWLRRDLAPLMDALLSEERIRRRGLFDPGEVRRRVDSHKAGAENHAHTLFSLMVFERWAQEFAE
jgi:asparagine synthase (glutamine-hydrolysing)